MSTKMKIGMDSAKPGNKDKSVYVRFSNKQREIFLKELEDVANQGQV